MEKEFNTTTFTYKLIPDEFLQDGKIKEDLKFNFTNPKFKIQNSKFLSNCDNFETMLFLPEGEDRKGEGGLRTKGYFKFSYKKVDDKWFICDFYGNIMKEAPEDIQKKIKEYAKSLNKDQNINELPLITVITVVLNGAKTLEETIQSVINQTYPNVEYIIIDGGSTDGTLDIIKKYENYIDYWISERDKGIYDGMNKGVEIANGKWINFMNAGDIFSTKKVLKESLKIFTINDIAIIYSDMIVKFGDYGVLKRAYNISKINYFMPFQHQCSFTKSSIIKECKFDTNFKLASDYNLFLLQYQKGGKFYYLNRPIA